MLSISSSAGPEWAPYYTIPLTILNVPLGVLLQLNAGLQPAYGRAIGRGDTEWISRTVTTMSRRVLTLLGVIGISFLILSQSFIATWTDGRIEVSYCMLFGVFLSGTVASLAAVYRALLAGANRHRIAAIGDLSCGFAAITVTPLVVDVFGADATGYSIFACTAITLAWLFPLQFRQIVGHQHEIVMQSHFLVRLALTCILAASLSIPISLAAKQLGLFTELAITMSPYVLPMLAQVISWGWMTVGSSSERLESV